MSTDSTAAVSPPQPALTQKIQGPAVWTTDLHEQWNAPHDPKRAPTTLSVAVPNDKWVFVGEPELVLVEDNKGSAAWNQLSQASLHVAKRGPTLMEGYVITGSRKILLRIDCLAAFYP